jgi:hypothetical protein
MRTLSYVSHAHVYTLDFFAMKQLDQPRSN